MQNTYVAIKIATSGRFVLQNTGVTLRYVILCNKTFATSVFCKTKQSM